MSKERELLGVALDFLDPRSWVDPEDQHVLNILSREIEELLAQPEQPNEPNLWVVTNPWGVNEYLWSEPREQVYENYKVTKFYRLPPKLEPLSEHVDRNKEWYDIGYRAAKEELKREPLSYEKVVDIIQSNKLNGLYDLARAIEKEHNIGVDDEH